MLDCIPVILILFPVIHHHLCRSNIHHASDCTVFVLVQERVAYYDHRHRGISETNILQDVKLAEGETNILQDVKLTEGETENNQRLETIVRTFQSKKMLWQLARVRKMKET